MEILFLGVGAGEFYPGMLCDCEICSRRREDGYIFGFSSILVNNRLLFDAPPGTSLNFALFKIKPEFPFHIFITHSHPDHFDPAEILSPRSNNENEVTVHVNRTTMELLEHYKKYNSFFDFSSSGFANYKLEKVEPFEDISISEDDRVIPILANHDKSLNEENLNYILKIKKKTILYACDTGWYDNDETWNEILKHRYDVVILEFSFVQHYDTHMNYDNFIKFIEFLKRNNSLDSKSQVMATHLHMHSYDESQIASLEKNGVKIAHRGMTFKC